MLLKINIKLAFVTFTYYCYLKITSKAHCQSLNTNHIIESERASQLDSNSKLHHSKERNALEKALN